MGRVRIVRVYESNNPIIILINFAFGVVYFLLLFRILFRLFGANSATPVVNWVFSATRPLMEPFRGLLPLWEISPGYEFDFTALLVLLIIMVVNVIIVEFLRIFLRD